MKLSASFLASLSLLALASCAKPGATSVGNPKPVSKNLEAPLILGSISDPTAKASAFDGKWMNCVSTFSKDSDLTRQQVVTIDRGYAQTETSYHAKSDCSDAAAKQDATRIEKLEVAGNSFLLDGAKQIKATDVKTKAVRTDFALRSGDKLDLSSPRYFGDANLLDNDGYPYNVDLRFEFRLVK